MAYSGKPEKLEREFKADEAFEHIVRLPVQAVDALHALQGLTGSVDFLEQTAFVDCLSMTAALGSLDLPVCTTCQRARSALRWQGST